VPERHLSDITLWQCLLAFLLVLLGLLLRRTIIHVIGRYREMDKLTALRLDERIVKTATQPLGLAVSLLLVVAAVKVLQLP